MLKYILPLILLTSCGSSVPSLTTEELIAKTLFQNQDFKNYLNDNIKHYTYYAVLEEKNKFNIAFDECKRTSLCLGKPTYLTFDNGWYQCRLKANERQVVCSND